MLLPKKDVKGWIWEYSMVVVQMAVCLGFNVDVELFYVV
jgi:hypothetical protein